MTNVKLTQAQVDHIANLSKLQLTSSDRAITGQLSEAAGYIQILNELNLDNVSPTFQVNHKHSIFRPDHVKPSLPQQVALSQAPKSYQGFFVTQATIKK